MFPGLGKIDPRKMQGVMKQLGMSQEDIPAEEVIIKKQDGSSLTISNPSIQKVKFQGQTSYQISGEEHEETTQITEDDVKLVAEKTQKSEEEARSALEETQGDIAEAIVKLSE